MESSIEMIVARLAAAQEEEEEEGVDKRKAVSVAVNTSIRKEAWAVLLSPPNLCVYLTPLDIYALAQCSKQLQAMQDQVCYVRWCPAVPSLIAIGKLRYLQLINWSGPDGDMAGPQGAMELAQALSGKKGTCCPDLHTIDLAGDCIEAQGAKALAEALMVRGAVAMGSGMRRGRLGPCVLDLNGNGVGEEGAWAIGEALGRPGVADRLHTLKLSFNNMGIEGARAVVEGLLRGRAQLTHLDLGGNHLCDDGAIMVAEALVTRTNAFASLQYLDLSFNLICAQGARAIAYALMTPGVCGGLRLLDLRYNFAGQVGSRALVQLATQRGPALWLILSGGSMLSPLDNY